VPFIPLALPSHDIADYLKRYGIAAILVLAPASECPCQFAIGIDVAKAVAEARRAWPKGRAPLRLAGARWAGSIASATKIRDMLLACDLRRARKVGNAFHIPVTEALAAVDSAARRLDIRLTLYGAAIERARAQFGAVVTMAVELPEPEYHPRAVDASAGSASSAQAILIEEVGLMALSL
jgi:hypothetical protein